MRNFGILDSSSIGASRLKKYFDIYDLYFLGILFLSVATCVFIVSGASVSAREADIFFENELPIAKLANLITSHFGQNDYALKFFNLLFHALNLTLIYLISRGILKQKRDSLVAAAIYALIPGVIMQGVIVNESAIMLFIVLFICYIEIRFHKIAYPVLFVAIFVDSSAFVLFLSLFFYAIHKKMPKTIIFALIAFSINLYLFGIDMTGRPSGAFLSVFGELSLLFSPLLFIYYIFTLYRNLTKERKSLLLFVSVVSIGTSILLSIRQEVDKEVFIFMSLCGIPLMVRQFYSDIRVRLVEFQASYKSRFIIILLCLVLESALLVFSKNIYPIINKPNGSFLEEFYIAKELSNELKSRNISRVQIGGSMQKRLKFYGIKDGGQPLKRLKRGGNIKIIYNNITIARYAI